jgi:hypothetical protein
MVQTVTFLQVCFVSGGQAGFFGDGLRKDLSVLSWTTEEILFLKAMLWNTI